jgi:UPF0755 protein
MRRPAVRIISLAVSLTFLAGLTALAYVVAILHTPGPAKDDITVVLARGMGLNSIGDLLEQTGVIESALYFGFWVRTAGEPGALRAGEYRFPARVSGAEVARMLAQGDTLKRKLTISEGLGVAAVRTLLAEAEGLVGVFDGDIPEGSLLPETYLYEWGDTRAELVARMMAAMAEVTAGLWARRDPGLALGTLDEAIILASIVEKETGLAEERPLVAGVFLNRLDRGMRLQSDPTVAYGLSLRGDFDRPLTRADLETDHPFNTYIIRGLPPGPIANPGRAAIEAVLHPLETEFLYFVADGQGGHAFAVTLEEHNRNVARYRQQ